MARIISLVHRLILFGVTFALLLFTFIVMGLGIYAVVLALFVSGLFYLISDPRFVDWDKARVRKYKEEESIRREAELREEGKMRAHRRKRQREERPKIAKRLRKEMYKGL